MHFHCPKDVTVMIYHNKNISPFLNGNVIILNGLVIKCPSQYASYIRIRMLQPFLHGDAAIIHGRLLSGVQSQIAFPSLPIYWKFRFAPGWKNHTVVWWCVLILCHELHYIKATGVLNYIATETFWWNGPINFPIAPIFHSGTHSCGLGKLHVNLVCVAPWLLCHARLWVRMNKTHSTIRTCWGFEFSCARMAVLNRPPPEQNGRQFADDIFRCIFANENLSILIKISQNLVPQGPMDNNPALV